MVPWLHTITVDHTAIWYVTVDNGTGFACTLKMFARFETIGIGSACIITFSIYSDARVTLTDGVIRRCGAGENLIPWRSFDVTLSGAFAGDRLR